MAPLRTHATGVRDFGSRPALEDPHAGGVRTQDFLMSRLCRRDDALKQRKTVSVFGFSSRSKTN
jgi:hypothetical protein